MKSACAAETLVRRDNARPPHESHMPIRRRWPRANRLDAPVGSFGEFLIKDAVALKTRSIAVHDATSRLRPAALLNMRPQSVLYDGLKLASLILRDLADLGEQIPVDLSGEFFAHGGHNLRAA